MVSFYNLNPLLFWANVKITLLISALWFVAFAWLVIVVLTIRGLSRQRSLLATNNLRLTASDAPLVSILVPARNEQHRVLEHCIRSMLAQDYGRFEVIAVNDRSTDSTGMILETLAQSDERLRAIEGEPFRSLSSLCFNSSTGPGRHLCDVV